MSASLRMVPVEERLFVFRGCVCSYDRGAEDAAGESRCGAG